MTTLNNSTFITATDTALYEGITSAGTGWVISANDTPYAIPFSERITMEDDSKRVYHPQLYFKYVKSKLTKIQQDTLKKRLNKLKKLIVMAQGLEQRALYEELSRKLAIAVRESEACACGIDHIVKEEDIKKLMNKVKGIHIDYTLLEKFPRTIPARVMTKINKIKKAGLFDSYWVLYTIHPKDELKTNKEKIKEKDPILFGKYDYQPEMCYFIIDWIDEYCDLTLDKFVDTMKEHDPDYALDQIPEMNEITMRKIVKEVKERHERLIGARPNNYKNFMDDEDKLWNRSASLLKTCVRSCSDIIIKYMLVSREWFFKKSVKF